MIFNVVNTNPTFSNVPNQCESCFSKHGRIENANASGPIMSNILNIITANAATKICINPTTMCAIAFIIISGKESIAAPMSNSDDLIPDELTS